MEWCVCAGGRNCRLNDFRLLPLCTQILCAFYSNVRMSLTQFISNVLFIFSFFRLHVCHRHLANQNVLNRLRITADLLEKSKSHLQLGEAITYWEPMYEHGLANKLIGGRQVKMCNIYHSRDGLRLIRWDIFQCDETRNDFSSLWLEFDCSQVEVR